MRITQPKSERLHTDFDRLFGAFRGRISGYLHRLTGNSAEAEDLTQETLLVAFRQQANFRKGAPPLAYLLGIAHRRFRDSRRSLHETQELQEEALTTNDGTSGWIEGVVLQAALAQLPERERRALELTAMDGRTYREAAQILGEPVGTLKWRVHQATQQLRIILANEEDRLP